MTKENFLGIVRQHALDNPGLLTVIFRCICYALLQLASMWLATEWFQDTYIANSALFLIFMIAFELMWSMAHAGPRKIAYVVAVIGLSLSGFMLLQQAVSFNKSCEACSYHYMK